MEIDKELAVLVSGSLGCRLQSELCCERHCSSLVETLVLSLGLNLASEKVSVSACFLICQVGILIVLLKGLLCRVNQSVCVKCLE